MSEPVKVLVTKRQPPLMGENTFVMGVDKKRTDKRRMADRGRFYKHMITTATNYNTLN
jgi:hypothetical protein